MFYLILLSIIPISLCCTIVILSTIAPFFWFKKNSRTNKDIFKKYFPFYAIVSFGLCSYGIYESKFGAYLISFFASAFFTTLQTWVLLVNHNKQKRHITTSTKYIQTTKPEDNI
ncbi:hypothetical protein A8C32_07390 [Flavivirga aquatica]|uniref:Uncharacterized protein n=2 Tax=Flavivirga aquatica TaxID=1849968 RepID=A0A1E5SIN8_9FLAO|nr:hypothetical protein A8C32_07390 [Flavivirga aquatica]